jgi:Protein of unknown function (DUF1045)
MDYTSYAIWWVPRPTTSLGRFGAEWTGWCADDGMVSGESAVESPRPGVPGQVGRHGLHATVRSAFRLAPGRSLWALEDALAELTERTEAIRLPPLELTVFDGRVALALSRPDQAVAGLLAAVDTALRPFRQPLPYARAADAAQSSGGEPGSAAAMLDRFHMPLTDRLDLGTAYEIVAELETRFNAVLSRQQTIWDLALVGDPGEGRRWRLLQRHALIGEPGSDGAPVPAGMAWRGPSLLAPFSGSVLRRRANA